ncbi:MAG: 16S rRNA (cytosine(1402)-N(4))-methyltransferase RsmH [Rickettsiales bacterium]|jgi:16S rRNA (cytosine1402-N4)-methyltransferase|nr:16S rRNA (cytosine(1402)-N(4))-methyltransferase RsmH [Rickettsiales bacterium]
MHAHTPVLLPEVLATLGDVSGETILDATFGAGGYSRAFLERGASVIAFDRDPSTIQFADKLKKEFKDRFTFINARFSRIPVIPAKAGTESRIPNPVTHIVFDFGVSSMQIDTPERGFSWRFDAPLDMRMDGEGPAAAELIENSPPEELAKILSEYGDVNAKLAAALARALKKTPPKTTFQLRDLIFDPKNTAKVFQAIRIKVNGELDEIERALAAVPALLSIGGICACVTFHSLEDRIVKKKFREWTTPAGDPRMPAKPADFILLKTLKPTAAELDANPRARSSHLRAARKIGNIPPKETI